MYCGLRCFKYFQVIEFKNAILNVVLDVGDLKIQM